MSASANKIEILALFKFVSGPEIEHLSDVMPQIKGCGFVNIIIIFPLEWRYYLFHFNMLSDVFKLGFLLYLIKYMVSKPVSLVIPVNPTLVIWNGNQDIIVDFPSGASVESLATAF